MQIWPFFYLKCLIFISLWASNKLLSILYNGMLFMVNLSVVLKMSFLLVMALTNTVSEAKCNPHDKHHKKQYEAINKQLNDLYHDSLKIPETLEWDATNCRWKAILPKI